MSPAKKSSPHTPHVRTVRTFRRFTRLQRWEHGLLILTVLLLLLTGLPQKYRSTEWSQQILSTPERVASLQQIHHITAIAGDPQRNLDFYTQVLGLRMVKLTVNFDDPGTYHFYFRSRATVAGQFTQPQARAELMYDAAVHGESVGARVEINAKDR